MSIVPRVVARAVSAVVCLAIGGAAASGCMSRPVVAGEPTTKINFTTERRRTAIDKVDLLLAIDNSGSMGDKQALLRDAVPDLVGRLVRPSCVDAAGKVTGATSTGADCPEGSAPEFPPVHDLHVGVVSSSLGGRGSDACGKTLPQGDDRGHLLDRAASGGALPDAAPSSFLAWFPPDANAGATPPPVPPLADAARFEEDVGALVAGAGEAGCGFEAQLESWYRFLVQPDPYDAIVVDASGRARLDGIDETVLRERHDFLRPDSLVAIVLLTDENDSTVDPLKLGGKAWAFESSQWPFDAAHGTAPHGTAACTTDPDSDACTTCAADRAAGDPSCKAPDFEPADDPLNLRFFHMKQRFGVDPQFPIARYVNGLTSATVPDRAGEHPPDAHGDPADDYVGTNDCQNPLFATDLPVDAHDPAALCHTKAGPRTKDLVYFAVIGGVPWQLLTEDRTDPASPFKAKLNEEDWARILGRDPLHYDFTGQDAHMLESRTPRPGLVHGSDDLADPYHGREWDPHGVDLEYACTFPLPKPRDCPEHSGVRGCDCDPLREGDPPLCGSATSATQVRGKAYPTIRELAVARALGDQAIVASLCPRVADPARRDDPNYGYRPAARAIVDRLSTDLAASCIPQKLFPNPKGEVPCLALLTLPDPPADDARCTSLGLGIPEKTVLGPFRAAEHASWVAHGGAASGTPDPDTLPVCVVPQRVVASGATCAGDADPVWCYVTGRAAGSCSQSVVFSAKGSRNRATVSLQCIETSQSASDAGHD